MMINFDREGLIFRSHPHTNNGFFFLLTIKYCIFMPPNFEIVEGAYCFGLVRVCVCMYVLASVTKKIKLQF